MDSPRLSSAVDVWLADLDTAGPVPPGVLTATEEQRRRRIRDPEKGRRWATARWALRVVLGRYLDEAPAAIELARGAHGKPSLARSPERLEFNLSHSWARAVVAVTAERAVGVDVERVDPDRDFVALAARGLGPGAARLVRDAERADRAGVFYAAWTEHEARLKCHGGGFGVELPNAPQSVLPLALDGGYAGAVAVAGAEPPPLRLYRLDLR